MWRAPEGIAFPSLGRELRLGQMRASAPLPQHCGGGPVHPRYDVVYRAPLWSGGVGAPVDAVAVASVVEVTLSVTAARVGVAGASAVREPPLVPYLIAARATVARSARNSSS